MKISIITWNILADCYSHSILKSSIDSNNYLHWDVRSKSIIKNIKLANADIICSQEVDHYDDTFLPLFNEMNYTSLYLQRPRKNDGCLIAFNNNNIELIDVKEIQLDEVNIEQDTSNRQKRFLKQNVALAAKLRLFNNKNDNNANSNNDSNRDYTDFIVSTCHVHWNPNLPEVKIAQVLHILQQLNEYRTISNDISNNNSKLPLLLCGDFNTLPNDEVYDIILSPNNIKLLKQRLYDHTYSGALYGPDTKFLCDGSLSRLCRWMRVLGIDVAEGTWESPVLKKTEKLENNSLSTKDNNSIINYFNRAVQERRVILTSSKNLRERSCCPRSFFVDTKDLEGALVDIYYEFGLLLNKDKFLTVCGKCGGEVEETIVNDSRLDGKKVPSDRPIYACVSCSQLYWWNEVESSKPARAMKKALSLHNMIKYELSKKYNSNQDASEYTSTVLNSMNRNKEIAELQGRNNTANDNSNVSIDNVDIDTLQEQFAKRNNILSNKPTEQQQLSDTIDSTSHTNRDVTMESSSGDGDGMELESVYRKVHNKEPKCTNWNGGFIGTLDYIYITKGQWEVNKAQVFPSVDSEDDVSIINNYDNSRSSGSAFVTNGIVNGDLLSLQVSGSQPSEYWPSDHFMLYSIVNIL